MHMHTCTCTCTHALAPKPTHTHTHAHTHTHTGSNLPALRHWLKAIRDSAYFTMNFAAAHLGTSFWYNQRLAGVIPQV
jgi:hypothetical protein